MAKHGGNRNSIEAFESILPTLHARQQQSLRVICRPGGATAKEIARELNLPLNVVSGRPSELRRMGLVRQTSERREKSGVWVPIYESQMRLLGEVA